MLGSRDWASAKASFALSRKNVNTFSFQSLHRTATIARQSGESLVLAPSHRTIENDTPNGASFSMAPLTGHELFNRGRTLQIGHGVYRIGLWQQ